METDACVFISHSSEDAALAHRLADDLGSTGVPVWIAPESIRPGEAWVEAINRGLQESTHLVVVLTPEAVASRWVRQEVNVAIARERNGELQVIPLDVTQCDLPPLWSAYQWISFRRSYESGLEQLQAAIAAGMTHRDAYPASRWEGALPQGVRASDWDELDSYALLYDALYPRLPGDLRNYVLNGVIVDQVLQLGSLTRFPPDALRVRFARGSDGDRLVSLLLLQTSPTATALDVALEAIQHSRSPFEQFHGLRAVEVMTHLLEEAEVERVRNTLDAARRTYLVPANRSRWHVYQNIARQLGISASQV